MLGNRGISTPNPVNSGSKATFIAALNELRQRAGHTYRCLGRLTGIPPSTLHDTLTNRRRPRLEVISAVTRVYATDQEQAERWLACWNTYGTGGMNPELGCPPPSGCGPEDVTGRGTGRRGQRALPPGSDGLSVPVVPVRSPRPADRWRPVKLVAVAVLMAVSAGAGAAGALLLRPAPVPTPRRLPGCPPSTPATR